MTTIAELERAVRKAESDLSSARSHNDQLAGRIESGQEELKKLGYKTEKQVLTAITRLRSRAEKKTEKLEEENQTFNNEFEEAKRKIETAE